MKAGISTGQNWLFACISQFVKRKDLHLPLQIESAAICPARNEIVTAFDSILKGDRKKCCTVSLSELNHSC